MADAGPLIHLSWIDRLDLLSRIFDEVIIPGAVRDEVLGAPPRTIGLDRIRRALVNRSFRIVEPPRTKGQRSWVQASEQPFA